jgi:hypothetical protein
VFNLNSLPSFFVWIDGPWVPVDDQRADAAPPELIAEHETGRAGPHDERVNIRRDRHSETESLCVLIGFVSRNSRSHFEKVSMSPLLFSGWQDNGSAVRGQLRDWSATRKSTSHHARELRNFDTCVDRQPTSRAVIYTRAVSE